jgi:hypothetical protein
MSVDRFFEAMLPASENPTYLPDSAEVSSISLKNISPQLA